jgi:type II secretory pathway pseudopilin PulG
MLTARNAREERGYAMIALLVAMSVMAIALSAALPVFETEARREREAELVFRGEQYARAIGMFQRKYGNALPPDVDVLVRERFLRKKYKDPITGDDFQVFGPGSPELAAALATPPAGAVPGGATQPTGRGGAANPQTPQQTTMTRLSQLASATGGAAQAGGGIIAVASKSKQTSIRLYNGKDKYNEWIFQALQASVAAGAPPGTGGQTPGGRGGAAPGGRFGRGNAPPVAPTGRGTPQGFGRGFGRGLR